MQTELEIQALLRKVQNVIAHDSILSELLKMSTTDISDALKGNHVMEPEMRPLDIHMKLIGRALTVKLPAGDSDLTHQATEQAKPGDILVVDTGSTKHSAVWGDVKTVKALKYGVGGIIIDGAIRDAGRIRELQFPAFSKYIVPNASKHEGGGDLNIPVSCGGVTVYPGDIVFGDINGVVVIPHSQVKEVIQRAKEKMESDQLKVEKLLRLK